MNPFCPELTVWRPSCFHLALPFEPRHSTALGLYSLRNSIPVHRALPVVRLVRHVTAERCVVTEHDVLHDRLPRSDGLEEIPKMRPQIVIVASPIAYALRSRFISRFGIVLVVPPLEVGIFQTTRKAIAVIARGQINPGLGGVAQTKLGKLDDALGAHKAGDFGRFRPQ